jgi:hypothetical protein
MGLYPLVLAAPIVRRATTPQRFSKAAFQDELTLEPRRQWQAELQSDPVHQPPPSARTYVRDARQ